jgi:hypothetical protein
MGRLLQMYLFQSLAIKQVSLDSTLEEPLASEDTEEDMVYGGCHLWVHLCCTMQQ